jgi:hypothetical protein
LPSIKLLSFNMVFAYLGINPLRYTYMDILTFDILFTVQG